ncbi:toprim domain-containing protein, partial [Pelagibacteraceae bacterium]|nr:toprim domain-containing protein [Pelagibacteraceae bacterium]
GYSYNNHTSLYAYLKNLSYKDEDILKSNVVKLDKNNNLKDFFYKRLIFPITNINGKVVGFGGRVLDNSNPKYINSPESNYFKKRDMLYNLNLAKDSARKKKNLLICEGYMDVISLYQNNIKSVVAPLGTSFTEEQLKMSWRYTDKPTIMFDGDDAGKRASYKVAIMSLPLLIPNKSLQFINLPKDNDPDSFLKNNKLIKLVSLLKKPIKLLNYIFDVSSGGVSLDDADQKISYDKYLDDLIINIKDKKIQYFYKSEFKSLFFKKLRNLNNNEVKQAPKKISSLQKKQIYSFIASAINHVKVRNQIIECIFQNIELNDIEKNILINLKKEESINKNTSNIINSFSTEIRQFLESKILHPSIYTLFPYSAHKYEPDATLKEIQESSKNLNTRLSNLKKINKSLITFDKDNTSLNWDDLQKISRELEENFNDN